MEVGSTIIAALALFVSGATLWITMVWRRRDLGQAAVFAYFHRNTDFAKVRLSDGSTATAGYNFVLGNSGPANARNVSFTFADVEGHAIELVEVQAGELPIEVLAAGALYPVPWLVSGTSPGRSRLVKCSLHWKDGRGLNTLNLQLRKGET